MDPSKIMKQYVPKKPVNKRSLNICGNNRADLNHASALPRLEKNAVPKLNMPAKVSVPLSTNGAEGTSAPSSRSLMPAAIDDANMPEPPSDCGLCGQNKFGSSSLPQHKCTHASNTLSCEIEHPGDQLSSKFTCENHFTLEQYLNHLLNIHNDSNKTLTPEICNNRLTKEAQLLFCDWCNKQFSRKSALIRHLSVHTGKEFSCKVCDKQFAQKVHLNVHERVHTTNKSFSCKVCNKQFTHYVSLTTHDCIQNGNKFALKEHTTRQEHMHTVVKLFSYSISNKQFTQRGNLTSHELLRRGINPFSCRICNKRFTDRASLTSHELLHGGVKPFSCRICNRKFTHRGYLANHERKHCRDKPFSCRICSKEYTKREHLIIHELVHNASKLLSCSTCQMKFVKKAHLITHERIHLEKSFR